ncbi:hypothetical protein MHC_01350 [Mycoplasma haemocanis str. Illinois]|uniref:Transmembrane protein n=1 Tax=Mycoplasma haemocanis (strain Illinois) TaxID=1111676 RepID=H6N664_MYCHN|nr:hypothetical protein [Mycoplasma haemocanis]AEW45136.1 hypothetical protein MHC_01350 [Mycoplasma haemocanis str. Illinois]
MGLLGGKAVLGLVGGAITITIGGGYFLFSNGKSLFKKKTGSFCVALSPTSAGGSSVRCIQTFKEEDQFKAYLESQGKATTYSTEATGLEEVLEKAKKAYEEGLVAFVYLESGSNGKKWVFPDQETWRKEYLKQTT